MAKAKPKDPNRLPHPYDTKTTVAKGKALRKAAEEFCKKLDHTRWDFGTVWVKPISKGIRFKVFCLSRHNSTLKPKMTKKEIEALRLELEQLVQKTLGPTAKTETHPFTKENRNAVDFFSYIAYEELL